MVMKDMMVANKGRRMIDCGNRKELPPGLTVPNFRDRIEQDLWLGQDVAVCRATLVTPFNLL